MPIIKVHLQLSRMRRYLRLDAEQPADERLAKLVCKRLWILLKLLLCLLFLPFTKTYTGAIAVRVNEDDGRHL
jgi:hypothetical protein